MLVFGTIVYLSLTATQIRDKYTSHYFYQCSTKGKVVMFFERATKCEGKTLYLVRFDNCGQPIDVCEQDVVTTGTEKDKSNE